MSPCLQWYTSLIFMHRPAVCAFLQQSALRRTFSTVLRSTEAVVVNENDILPTKKLPPKEKIKVIFNEVNSNEASSKEIINAFNQLKSIVTFHGKDVLKPERVELQQLFVLLLKNIESLSVSNISNAVLFLASIGYEFDKQSRNTIVSGFLKEIKRSPVGQIIQVIASRNLGNPIIGDIEVQNEAVQTLQKRWVEVRHPVDLCRVLQLTQHFNKTFLSRIEDAIVESVENSKFEEKVSLMLSLYKAKRRPTPALRALGYHLSKSPDKMNMNQCIGLLYAVSGLSFHDPGLIERICNDAVSTLSMNKTTPVQIGKLATSLGILRYRHKELLEQISEWCISNPSVLEPSLLIPVVMTLATVDYHPINGEAFFKLVEQKLTPPTVGSSSKWIDVVWAMTILGIVKPETIVDTLKESQVEKLAEEKTLSVSTKIKLAILTNYAETLDNKPELNSAAAKKLVSNLELKRPEDVNKLSELVIDSLSNFLLPPKFLKVLSTPVPGILVDAECILDRKFHPFQLDRYDLSNMECKPLPRDASRVAVMVLGYKDVCLGSVHPIGLCSLYRRLLESKGYKVVTVPSTDFPVQSTLQSKLKYLEQRLKEACDYKHGDL